MKKFILKSILFLVIIYSLAWGLDYVISTGQTMMDGYPQQTWREIRSGEMDADVVILGTSRGLEHYDPYVLDSITKHNFYNLGMGGYAVNNGLMKYHCYCRHNPKPKYVIVDVDHIWFHIDNVCHGHQSEQFLPLFYETELCDDLLTMGYTRADAFLPLYRYWGYQTHIKRGIFTYLHLTNYHPDIPAYRGFAADPGTWSLSNLQFHDSIPGEMQIEAQKLFEDFVKECKNDSVQMILVTSPRYYRCTEMTTRRVEECQYIDSLCQQWNLPYLDYATDYWMCKDSTLFNAGVHLTPEGTRIFSKELADSLKKILSE